MFKKKAEKFEEDFNTDCELALQVLRKEKENAEQYGEEALRAYIKLEKENEELKEQLTKAKELIEKLLNAFASNDFFEEEELSAMGEAEQFLKELKWMK